MLRAVRNVAAAGVGIAAAQGIEQMLEGQARGAQAIEIGLHLILLDQTAHGDHVGHARHLAQRAFDCPVLDGAQVGGVVAIALDAVTHDLAHRRGVGRDIGFDTGRQVDPAQALIDLRAYGQDIGLVVVGDDGEGQTELGVREHPDRVGQPRQGHFDRQGHLLFDLLGGAARVQGDHGDLGVGDVGEGLDRQVQKGQHAGDRKQHRPQNHQQRLVQREMNQSLHREAPARAAEAALAPAAAGRTASSASRYWRASISMFWFTT